MLYALQKTNLLGLNHVIIKNEKQLFLEMQKNSCFSFLSL